MATSTAILVSPFAVVAIELRLLSRKFVFSREDSEAVDDENNDEDNNDDDDDEDDNDDDTDFGNVGQDQSLKSAPNNSPSSIVCGR